MLDDLVIKYWLPAQAVLTAVFSWVMWSFSKKFASPEYVQAAIERNNKELLEHDARISEEHEELQKLMQKHHEDMVQVQATIKHMPTHQDLATIHRRMDDMNAKLQTISGRAEESTKTLRLIHEFLLKENRA